MASGFLSKLKAYVGGTNPLLETFLGNPYIQDFDRIILFLIGGGGGIGLTVQAMFEEFPALRKYIKVVKIDFNIDPAETDGVSWEVVPLGRKLDMTLREAIAKHGVPEDLFTPAEYNEFKTITKSNAFGDHSFLYGAGAEPLLGRYGMFLATSILEEQMLSYFLELKTEARVAKIFPIAIIGTSGGTGAGIFEESCEIILSVAKAAGLNGFTGLSKIFLGWRAYLRILYESGGNVTSMAPRVWSSTIRMYNSVEDSFFVTSELGPHGLLGCIQIAAEKMGILNNRYATGAYRNALISSNEVTGTTVLRLASRLIGAGDPTGADYKASVWKFETKGTLRRETTVAWSLDVDSVKTVRELAQLQYFLAQGYAKRQLLELYAEKNQTEQISKGLKNWEHVDAIINDQLVKLRDISQKLRQLSQATGNFILSDETGALIDSVKSAKIDDVFRGRARISFTRKAVAPIVPVGEEACVARQEYLVGDATLLFELGKKLPDGSEPLNIPGYVNKSEAEIQAEVRAKIKEAAQNARLSKKNAMKESED